MLPRVLSDWQNEKLTTVLTMIDLFKSRLKCANDYEDLAREDAERAIADNDHAQAAACLEHVEKHRAKHRECFSTLLELWAIRRPLNTQVKERSLCVSPYNKGEPEKAEPFLVMTDKQKNSVEKYDSLIKSSWEQLKADVIAPMPPLDVRDEHFEDWYFYNMQKIEVMDEVIRGEAMELDAEGIPERVLSEYPQPNDRDWMSGRPASPILASRKDWIPANTAYPRWRMLKNDLSACSIGPTRKAKSLSRSVSPIERLSRSVSPMERMRK